MMRSTMAPALPNMIAGRRYLSERLWQAIAMTTALSPDRMMLATMIFHNAAQNTADDRSGNTKTIRGFSRGAGTIAAFPLDATGAIRRREKGRPHGNRCRLQQDVPRVVDRATPRCARAGLAAGRSRAVQGPGGDHPRRAGARRHHRPR